MEFKPHYDVIVVGGGVAGCLSALYAAREGARVLVIEPRTYLGREFTATLRPWIGKRGLAAADPLIVEVLGLGDSSSARADLADAAQDELLLQPGLIKKSLLKRLRQAKADVLFMSGPAGVLESDGRAAGVLIANKSGLQAVTAATVIDATENQALALLSGWNGGHPAARRAWHRTVEWSGVKGDIPTSLTLPEAFGAGPLLIRRGERRSGQVYAEFSFESERPDASFPDVMQAELHARALTVKICEYLRNEVPGFQDAVLIRASEELWTPAPVRLTPRTDGGGLRIANADDALAAGWNVEALEGMRVRVERQVRDALQEVHAPPQPPTGLEARMRDYACPFDELDPEPRTDPVLNIPYYAVKWKNNEVLPGLGPADVLVAGGGTSGAPAAIGAAESGAQVLLIEGMSGLGGTGTLGGINLYWFGYKEGFTAELDGKTEELTRRISNPSPGKLWNVEAKMMVYLNELTDRNVKILLRTRAVDVTMRGRRIAGVTVITPDGLMYVPVECAVDATGDGDLAALAGVPHLLGEQSGGNVQTFNMCEWKTHPALAGVNLDIDVIDATDVFDTTRGIMLGHENGDAASDFSPYPAVRESRHIRGRYVLSVADVLSARTFPDAIAVGSTDYDQHGLQSSDFARMGYLPYHQDCKKVRIPYQACFADEAMNLLVTGKAFSAERDAFSFMRMQPDLQNMGYAVGLAAAQAVREKTDVSGIDLRALQRKLLDKGNIAADDLLPPRDEDPESLIAEAGDAASFVRILCLPEARIVPMLKQCLNRPERKPVRLEIAMALAWFGEADGLELLLEAADSLRTVEQPTAIDHAGRPVGGFIKQPDAYWKLNQIITVLGRSGDPRALDMLCAIARETDAGGAQIPHAKLHWRRIPHYDRVVCLCRGIGRLADPRAIPALEQLLAKPYMSGYVQRDCEQAPGTYASALLELIIAETLAKCGGRTGYRILIAYLADVRAVLSKQAHASLTALAARNFGYDRQAWESWLERQAQPNKA